MAYNRFQYNLAKHQAKQFMFPDCNKSLRRSDKEAYEQYAHALCMVLSRGPRGDDQWRQHVSGVQSRLFGNHWADVAFILHFDENAQVQVYQDTTLEEDDVFFFSYDKKSEILQVQLRSVTPQSMSAPITHQVYASRKDAPYCAIHRWAMLFDRICRIRYDGASE